MAKKVMVGISGGVDSAASAALLKKQGYEVSGCTMVVFENKNTQAMLQDARAVCNALSIPHRVIDLQGAFRQAVVDDFVQSYRGGETPNPCVLCNKRIKFGAMLEYAKSMGMDFIATGHYARIGFDADSNRYLLYKSDADLKDQTYFLYTLTQDQLRHVKFPLYEYDKDTVRKIAQESGIPVFSKKDSQEICFIEDDDYIHFLQKHGHLAKQPGNFVDSSGNVLGRHDGIFQYTIGQRKGLGISFGEPKYVVAINAEKNEVILGANQDLFHHTLEFGAANFIPYDVPPEPMTVEAKVRYGAKPAKAKLLWAGEDRWRLVFEEPQRAVTKGQSVVLYHENLVLGGGVIQQCPADA